MLVLHDDAQREFANGPAAGLPGVPCRHLHAVVVRRGEGQGWTVISIKNDWKRVFAFD